MRRLATHRLPRMLGLAKKMHRPCRRGAWPAQSLPVKLSAVRELSFMGEFSIGQSVRRREDPRLLMGRGRYYDDLKLADQFHAAICARRTPMPTSGASTHGPPCKCRACMQC
jgi:hypothetical protein